MHSALSKCFFNQSPVADLKSLLEWYSADEFASPFRSTIPLLALVRDGQMLLRDIFAECSLPVDPELHFEFKVEPPLGVGKASHTDLMIRAGDDSMAIECKWTEPQYENVGEWLRRGREDNDNRRAVLSGWIGLLQRLATREVQIADLMHVTYQTVHRAASACAEALRPQMSYLRFGDGTAEAGLHREAHLADLQNLKIALGSPAGFPLHVIEIDIVPTAAFDRISMLPKASQATANAVKGALIAGPLFAFQAYRCIVVR